MKRTAPGSTSNRIAISCGSPFSRVLSGCSPTSPSYVCPRDGRFHWLRVVDQVADEPELHRLRHVRRVVDDHVGANQPARRLAIENGVESSVAAAVEIERGLARIDAEVSLAAGNYFLNANFEDPHPARLPLP